ncbi:alkane 1-monooxygenase [Aureispira anguillae]|uniref:Alkane 1-monooxygenase n=1 Tax=Aureispira anguillae TaxID=2864201 RepID=A0A916DU98_9BACT|nr:alkane 1-monooxygenase [Aureispira anguillae]BDS12071.1 alkane 1-monooxygenase [Aureispira anguillae]
MWKDLKYLFAYIIPAIVIHALYYRGIWSYNGVTVSFVLIPLLEAFFPGNSNNLTTSEEQTQASKFFFTLLLYLNVPILLGISYWYFYSIANLPLATYEMVGLTLTVGIYLGGVGINVAHELGHRNQLLPQLLSKILLIPNLYMHFAIEHNHGHHVHIATPQDPASSRFNETIYAFYIRSVVYSYLSAWKIEAKRLQKENKTPFSIYNQMIHFQLIQIGYLTFLVFLFDWAILPFALLAAILGFLMLETVNYIEHYGLQRRQLESGRYEAVQPWHSWNCNHDIGRILLYELTRHSDHHYKSNRQYQILRHFEKAPLLPWGYPTSMLIAMIPPLWFYLMNPRVIKMNHV